ncbi:MAG: hypothetical protein VB102_07440 [Paludibacter sp.]|nr:hypothetical protein [Paludibacter sp.]
MKTINKIALLLFAIIVGQISYAQNETKQMRGTSYLPEAGSYAIGADATPVFNFIGNMFNGTTNNQFDLSSPLIYAKYYLSDITALRTVLGVNSISDHQLFYVNDDAAHLANPLSNAQVTDMRVDKINGYYLSLGLQKFIGQKRLRGFYGGQLFTQYSKNKTDYTYGNPMTELNPTPTSNFAYNQGERTLSEVSLNDFMFGAGGIAGFEYYIIPRLCIGGEVSLNIVYSQEMQRYIKTEKMMNDKHIFVDKAISPGGHELNFKSSSFTPNSFQHVGLYVMLHF